MGVSGRKTNRQNKVEALRMHWRRRREELNLWSMMKKLESLSLRDLDMEMLEIDSMIKRLVMEDEPEDEVMVDVEHVYGLEMCGEMVIEMVEEAFTEARMRPCRQLVEQDLTDRVWKRVEHRRILMVIEYESLGIEIEQSLREAREVKEAEMAMMKEEEMVKKRLEKLEELRKLWKKKKGRERVPEDGGEVGRLEAV